MKISNMQQEAQRLGFPASLFGFTPNAAAYWVEPALAWTGAGASQPEQGTISDDPTLLGPWLVWNDEMAPRFMAGTRLAGRRLVNRQEVAVGQVLAWVETGTPASRFELARVQGVAEDHLLLRCDLSGRECQLRWQQGAVPEGVCLVTHYVSQPVPWVHRRSATLFNQKPGPESCLLLVADNRMGPRYPVGARYWCRPLPRTEWATARGVHALHLRDGRELLARLISQHCGDLVLSLDDVGQSHRVALADVVQVWKLGAADYLPDETEAEHLWMLQRRAE